jgi:flagellar hook-associated protein 3 FlgL
MTRVTDQQSLRSLMFSIQRNKNSVDVLSEQLSSGLKVRKPSDSNVASEISRFQQALDRISGFEKRIGSVRSFLQFQDDALKESSDILVRAKEIAQQAANSTNNPEARRQLAEEVFQIRDHLASLANSTYQGKYVWGGADDDDPPFDPATYTNPATGQASRRFVFDGEDGTAVFRSVQVSDDLTVTVNADGQATFEGAIHALERLGRALSGYATNPATGAPDGTGNAYTFPADFETQTQAIRDSIDLIEDARKNDILVQRVEIGGKLRRLETAESLMRVSRVSGEEALSKLQDTDMTEAASQLSQIQIALQASYVVTNRVLNLSVLDYL